jgi:hypothetical protein
MINMFNTNISNANVTNNTATPMFGTKPGGLFSNDNKVSGGGLFS